MWYKNVFCITVNIQNTFLYKTYRDFKLLFAIVVLWAVGSLWYALHSHEEFPFLLFGMYSLKQQAKPEYTQYALITDDGKEFIYANLKDPQRELLQHGIANTADATQSSPEFVAWVKRTTTKGQPFKIVLRRYTYNAKGQPVETSTQIVYPHGEL
ncbi:MAG: hypothetical protein RLZZ367_2323 [Bacteroidota bacterium]|jgi:hypothetical protein